MGLADGAGIDAVKEFEKVGLPEAEQEIEQATDHAAAALKAVLQPVAAQFSGLINNLENALSAFAPNAIAEFHGVLDRLNGTKIVSPYSDKPVLQLVIPPRNLNPQG